MWLPYYVLQLWSLNCIQLPLLVKSASYESHRKKTCDVTFSEVKIDHWVHMVTA